MRVEGGRLGEVEQRRVASLPVRPGSLNQAAGVNNTWSEARRASLAGSLFALRASLFAANTYLAVAGVVLFKVLRVLFDQGAGRVGRLGVELFVQPPELGALELLSERGEDGRGRGRLLLLLGCTALGVDVGRSSLVFHLVGGFGAFVVFPLWFLLVFRIRRRHGGSGRNRSGERGAQREGPSPLGSLRLQQGGTVRSNTG